MNKKFLLAWLAVFVIWMLGSFVVHGLILGDAYAQLPELYRTEAETESLFPLMLLAHVIMAGAFVWIYSRGIEERAWLPQGLRFGVAVALLALVPTYIIYYVVQPLPGTMVVQQIIFDAILVLLLGVLVAYLYRERAGEVAAAGAL